MHGAWYPLGHNKSFDPHQDDNKKKEEAPPPPKLLLKDVHIVIRGDHYETVEKDSFEGYWLSFKNWVCHWFSEKSQTDINLQNIFHAFQSDKQGGNIDGISIIKEVNEDTDLDDEDFATFALNHISKYRFSTDETPTDLPKDVVIVKKRDRDPLPLPLADKKIEGDGIYSNLTSLLEGLTEKEIETVASVVMNSPEKSHLIKTLSKVNEEPNQARRALNSALLTSLSTAQDNLKRAAYNKALKTLNGEFQAPPTANQAPPTVNNVKNKIELREVGQVLGDAFIANTELEGKHTDTAAYAKLAVEYLESRSETQRDKALIQELNEAIKFQDTESAEDTIEAIKEKLDAMPDGQKRCLLFGGLTEQAVVYEIEKNPGDDNYSIRIFSTTEGIEFNETFDSKYRSKYGSCVALTDISAKDLLNPSFISALKSLSKDIKYFTLEENREYVQLKLKEILINLKGKLEEVPEDVQRFIAPNRSGVGEYRSLQAFFAYRLNANEYKQFKFEFKLFLLEKYLPNLKNQTINDDGDYQRGRLERSIIKLTIEKFANGIKKLESRGALSDSEIERAQKMIKDYNQALKELDSKLIQFEKTQSKTIANISTAEYKLPKVKEEQIENPLIIERGKTESKNQVDSPKIPYANLMKKIDRIPNDPNAEDYAKVIENIITELHKSYSNKEYTPEDLFLVFSAFFRKIGSLKNLANISFQSPKQILDMTQDLCLELIYKSKSKSFELSMCIFTAFYLAECAYRKLPSDEQIFKSNFPSFINDFDFSTLKYASSDDAFWVFCYEEMIEIQNDNRSDSFKNNKLLLNIPEYTSTFKKPNWYFNDEISKSISTKFNDKIKEIIEQGQDLQNLPYNWNRMNDKEKTVYLLSDNHASFLKDKLGEEFQKLDEFKKFYKLGIATKNALHLQKALPSVPDFSLKITLSRDKPEHTIIWDVDRLQFKQKGAFQHVEFNQHYAKENQFRNGEWSSLLNFFHVQDKDDAFNKDETYIPQILQQPMTKRMYESITKEEARDLLSIRRPNIQIDGTLSYFKNHFEKLTDKNWVLIFHLFLFESNYLVVALSDPLQNQALLNKFRVFFQEAMTYAKETGNYSLMGNLLWIQGTIQSYIDQASLKLEQPLTPPLITFEAMLPYLKEVLNPQHREHWPVFFESFIAACSHFKLSPESGESKEMISYMLLVNLFRNEFPVPVADTINIRKLKTEQVIGQLTHACFKDEDPPLTPSDFVNFLNKQDLSHLVFPGLSNTFMEGAQPGTFLTTDKQFELNLSYGFIQATDDEPIFKYVPTLDQKQNLLKAGLVKEEDLDFLRCCQKGDLTFIRNGQTNPAQEFIYHCTKTLIVKEMTDPLNSEEGFSEKTVPLIYVKLQTGKGSPQFTEFLHKGASLANIGKLEDYYHHFVFEGRVYVCDKQTLDPIYQGQITDGILKLTTVNPPYLTACKPDGTFKNFEHPSFTNFWGNEQGALQKIEFLRMGISFNRSLQSDKKEKWVYEQDKNWFISEEQFIPHFGSTGYLVLENAKGQKKVILPVLEPEEPKKQVLNSPYQYKFDNQNQPVQFLEFNLISKGTKIIPRSLEGRFHLARIYFEKGFQDLAEELIFSPQARSLNRAYSPEEKAFLGNILLSAKENKSAGAVRLKLYAFALLERNDSVFHSDVENDPSKKGQVELIHTLYLDYLNKLGHTPPLEQNDEIYIIKFLKANPDSNEKTANYLTKRYAELKGQETLIPENPIKEISISFPSFEPLEFKAGEEVLELSEVSSGINLKYKAARQNNEFCFDYRNPELDEKTFFNEYFPLIKKECDRSKGNSKVMENGLIPLLYYLATFSQSPKIKKNMQKLILDLEYTPPKLTRSTNKITTATTKSPLVKIRKEAAFQEGLNSLFQLDPIPPSTDELKFLPGLCTDYLNVEEVPLSSEDDLNLFNPDNVEVNESNRKQFETEKNELKEGQKQLITKNYSLKSGQELSNCAEKINNKLTDASKTLAEQEASITQAVTSLMNSTSASALSFASKKRQLPSISELCMICASEDAASKLRNLYPEFTDIGVQTLIAAVKSYLIQKQFVQHLSRCLGKIEEYIQAQENASPETLQTMMNDLGAHLATGRHYDVENDKHALAFLALETALNIKLYEMQIAKINLMQKGNVSSQALMGSGKTEIIQPLLAFLFAKSGSISTVCVPEELYPVIVENLSKILGESFNKYVFCMPFSRELSKDPKYLKTYLKNLRLAKELGACVLQTPRQRHALQASLLEAYSQAFFFQQEQGRQEKNLGKQPLDNAQKIEAPVKDDHERSIELIVEICEELDSNEFLQVDEADKILDPNIVFKFPVGEKKPVDNSKASIVSELIIELAKDRSFCGEVSIDFCDAFQKRYDPKYVKKGKQPTQEVYESIIKPKLLEIALKILGEHSSTLGVLLKDEQNKNLILNFLSETPPSEESIKFLAGLNPNEKEMLGVCSLAIREILPENLLKEYGVHYGPDPSKERSHLACSYNAPNDPKRTVRTALKQVADTTQKVLFTGITEKSVRDMLKTWQTQAKMEKSTSFEKTDGYLQYKKAIGNADVSGFSFLTDPPKQAFIDILVKALNANPASIPDYLRKFAYPQSFDYTKSISKKSAETFGMHKRMVCYTGTPQPSVLPLGMTDHREIGSDGKTVVAVETKIRKGEGEVKALNEKDSDYLSQVTNDFKTDHNLYVFIDSGNWLKSANLEKWARKTLEECREARKEINGIVIPNAQGQWVSLEYYGNILIELPLSQSSLKPEERLTIIPGKYETGTNIKQKPTAKAFVSIRKGMTLRDVRQSVFRMRQLLQGQSISFGVSEEVKDHIYAQMLELAIQKTPFQELLLNPDLTLDQIPTDSKHPIEAKIFSALRKFIESEPLEWKNSNRSKRMIKLTDYFCQDNVKIESDVLWRYFEVNVSRDEQNKEWEAGCQRMHAVMTTPLVKILCNKKIPYKDRQLLFNKMNQFFISTEEESLFNKMSARVTNVTGQAGRLFQVDQYAAQFQQSIVNLEMESPALSKTLLENIQRLYGKNDETDKTLSLQEGSSLLKETLETCMNPDMVPGGVTIGENGSGDGDELEIEQEKDAQIERDISIELDKELEMELIPGSIDGIGYFHLCTQYTSHENMYELKDSILSNFYFQPVKSYVPEGLTKFFGQERYDLKCSPNYCLAVRGVNEEDRFTNTTYRLPGAYLLISLDPEGKKIYSLISNQDASEIKPHLLQAPNGMILMSYADPLGTILPVDAEFDREDKDFQMVMVQGKILNGRIDFTINELKTLNDWIDSQEDPAQARRELAVFFEKIVSGLDSTRKLYPGSAIQKLLNAK